MGLGDNAYITGWICYFQGVMFMIACFVLLTLTLTGVINPDGFNKDGFEGFKGMSILVLVYLVFNAGVVMFIMFLSVFF